MPLEKKLFITVNMTDHTTAKSNQVKVYICNSDTVNVRVLVNYILCDSIDLNPQINPKIKSMLK